MVRGVTLTSPIARPRDPRRPVLRGLLAAAAGIAATLAACSAYLDSRVEEALKQALVRVVGPAASYDVGVSGASADGTRFDRVRFTGRRVARDRAPVIDRLSLELRGVVVDRAEKRLAAVVAANGEVRILGADLADYLVRRGWMLGARVAFEAPDRIVVTGIPQIGGIAFPGSGGAEFRGRLSGGGSQLRLTIERLRFGSMQAPSLARAVAERALNPLVDTASYPLPARFDAVEADGDTLRIAASGSRLPASVP